MPIYLDYCSTTPVNQRVSDLMQRLFVEDFGNSGSRTHLHGAKAKQEVSLARNQIAEIIKCEPLEVVFTSGATESNNMAILGLEEYGNKENKKHIITTSIEHKAVIEPIDYLETKGFEITRISPDQSGRINSDDIKNSLREDTLLISVMHVNNETGIIQPIDEIIDIIKNHQVFFHVDAAQSFGKLNEPLQNKRIDMMSLSGHKIYGPKGVGALITRDRDYKKIPLKPLFYGGGQERGLRPGTLPVPLVAGFSLASKILSNNNNWFKNCWNNKARLIKSLPKKVSINGNQEFAMPNILNFSILDYDSEALIVMLKDKISISNGSACTSTNYEPSHVLNSMGLEENVIKSAVRVSWSYESIDFSDYLKL